MKPGYVLIGGYEVLPPVTSHNAGYLEGAAWQKGVMGKEVDALKRRVRILELKLISSRAMEVLSNSGDLKETDKAGRDEFAAHKELEAMNLTPEEKAL